MTDAELLAKVKSGLGITTSYQDETLQIYIDEVKEFMRGAGVEENVITDKASVGCILQGVNDLWNYTSGTTKFSPHFTQRLIQLSAKKGDSNV